MASKASVEYIEQLSLPDKEDQFEQEEPQKVVAVNKVSTKVARLTDLISHDVELRPQIISAEPHMGRTTVATQVAMQKASNNVRVRIEDLDHTFPEEALQRVQEVVRWVRKQEPQQCSTIIVFDNLPVGDECQRMAMVAALRRLASSGVMLIVVCDLLGELLAQDFCEARCYWSYELCVSIDGDEMYADSFEYATQGVPRLANAYVHAYRPEGDCFGEYMMSDPGYLEAYSRVIEDMLRTELMNEERYLRCMMLILGQGSLEDLESILTVVDRDLWRMVARDVPALGINISQQTFCCVSCHALGGIHAVFKELENATSDVPGYVGAAASLLAVRGEYARAALVCKLCTDAEMRRGITLRWLCEFVDAGEIDFVLKEVSAIDAEDRREAVHNARVLLASLGLFSDGSSSVVHTGGALRIARLGSPDYDTCIEDHTQTAARRKSMLAARARYLLGEKSSWTIIGAMEEDDEISLALVTHCNAFVLMADGAFEEAFDLLSSSPQNAERDTVTSALLEMDCLVCTLMMGISPGEGQLAALRNAEEFLQRCGLRALRSVVLALPRVAKTLMGREPPKLSFEACVQRAERAGDTFLRGVFLLADAVSDMREKAFMRAHVRLCKAIEDFAQADAVYLNRAARLLSMAVRMHFGERVLVADVQACCGVSRDMDYLVSIFAAAVSKQKRRPTGSRSWGSKSCPRSILWLLNILANDSGTFSARIQDMLPTRWRDTLVELGAEVDASYEQAVSKLGSRSGLHVTHTGESHLSADDEEGIPRLEICLLGGLVIRVNGKPTQCSELEQRRAKALLTFLSVVPGHSAQRFSIIETIWPDFDYDAGNHNLYTATSVLRRVLSQLIDCKVGAPPLVMSRKGAGTVYLNTNHMSFDVDVFERKARQLLDCEGNNRVAVSLCRDVEELYKGDFIVPSTDGAGIMLARATELRTLYADAMIAGSEAALGVGMRTLACRFARKAYDADNMREDAIRTLVTALCGAGRHIEARRYYDRYVSRVVKSARRPPSRRLREVVEELLRGVSYKDGTERKREANPTKPVEIVETHAVLPVGQLQLNLGNT